MQMIPNLWFNENAEEAIRFYTSLFENSRIQRVDTYGKAASEVSGMEEGKVLSIEFEINGHEFVAINGGDYFRHSPAISLFVNCKSKEEVGRLHKAFSEEGSVLMELGEYPFSPQYAWVEDRYGVSWQLIYTDGEEDIRPALLFVGKQFGKAEEAMKFYSSVFENSKIQRMERYEKGEQGKEGAVKYAELSANGQKFVVMENDLDHKFEFTGAISFLVPCESQKQIDELWSQLTKEGKEQPCGWLRDKYGIYWQITPQLLLDLIKEPDLEKKERVLRALYKMNKIEIKELQQAANKP